MSSSGGDYHDVHLGFWTDWAQGRVNGATITLTRTNGSLLIAFLALFVAATGKSFWRLLCLGLHQLLSDPTVSHEGFYHQRQAILRNSDTALQGGWELFTVVLAWRRSRSGQRVIRRGIPLAAFAVVMSASFSLAGIFSSRVSTEQTSEVLLSGASCDRDIDYPTFVREYAPWTVQRQQEFLFYARSCYQDNSDIEGCNFFVKPRLQFQRETNASCPFDNSICISEWGNLRIDTGFINTNDDLGMNTAPGDRLEFRHVYQCAPLKTESYSELVDYEDPRRQNQTTKIFRLFYGEFAGWSVFRPEYQNYTYQVPTNITYADLDTGSTPLGPLPDYQLGYATAWGSVDPAYFNISYRPVPQLLVPETDTILLFLSAPDISFLSKVDDPWFSAHQIGKSFRGGDEGQEQGGTFDQDTPVSTLGCTRQVQYCRASNEPDDQRCEPLRGLRGTISRDIKLGKNEHQQEIFDTLMALLDVNYVPIEYLVAALGSQVLLAKSSLSQAQQGALPSNQWQLEIENLISANLAGFQGQLIDAAKGPRTAGIAKVWSYAESPVQKQICSNQKIISTRYPSFSVLGLSIILGIGGLVILLDFVLEPTIRRIHERPHLKRKPSLKGGYTRPPFGLNSTSKTDTDLTKIEHPSDAGTLRLAEWNANSTLQLQRLAHEALDAGTWRRTSSSVPITSPNQHLARLGFMEPPRSHPYLFKPIIVEDIINDGKREFEQSEEKLEKRISVARDSGADNNMPGQGERVESADLSPNDHGISSAHSRHT
ncbi:hypothetical protein EJ04DRAFT_582442 [Polyplosphaeria fusca]|uniref:Uncharacterized protein n=1 Tax=Polyplosphaeria fusca TaxID=682080 RepID=A0A9P4QJU1_9PLEO|nr:hypothetical protein EJ04DRAFT_582442 [Polyplosphaeria fusca]